MRNFKQRLTADLIFAFACSQSITLCGFQVAQSQHQGETESASAAYFRGICDRLPTASVLRRKPWTVACKSEKWRRLWYMTIWQSLFFVILAAGYLFIGFSLAVRGFRLLFRRGRQVLSTMEAPRISSRKWNRSWIGPWREKSFVGTARVAKTQPDPPAAKPFRLVEIVNEKRSRASLPETRTPDACAEPLPQRVA
jgi:hypothetical protein